MSGEAMKLVDPAGKVVAVVRVACDDDTWGGTIDLQDTPAEVRQLFEEFEEVVNGQMFSFLDDVQGKIDALGLKTAGNNGYSVPLRDLQVFPSTGEVSFKLAKARVESGHAG